MWVVIFRIIWHLEEALFLWGGDWNMIAEGPDPVALTCLNKKK